MSRKYLSVCKPLIVVAALALSAPGVVFADDSSMSMWTGDSYAFFNNLDYSPGKFNTARAPQTRVQDVAETSPGNEQERLGQHVIMTRPSYFSRPSAVTRPSLVPRPSTGTRTNPFRDDTGQ